MQTIEGIDSARVHLVIPERQIFSRDEQSPSASVVLKTRGLMQHGQVEAIQHLVAAAVSGLSPERVAVVDDRGNLLAGGDDKSGPEAMAANQDQQTTDYEDRMRQRIENIVASVVGPGHVRVQVTADMNYNHTNTTSETYDPDSKVVRSTQTVEQNSSDANAQSSAASIANQLPNGQSAGCAAPGDNGKSTNDRTEETTNYEISKTVKTSSDDGGTIKKLSVAVVVDGQSTTDPVSGKSSYRARTPAEMKQIESLVSSTVCLDKARGDQLQVTNMQFAAVDGGLGVTAPTPFLGLDGAYWFKIIEAAILSITALLIGLFVMRPLISRMFAPITMGGQPLLASQSAVAGQLPAPAAVGANGEMIAAPDGPAPLVIPARKGASIDLSQIEGQVKESAVRKVGEVVQAHPEEALAILRTWLHQQA